MPANESLMKSIEFWYYIREGRGKGEGRERGREREGGRRGSVSWYLCLVSAIST